MTFGGNGAKISLNSEPFKKWNHKKETCYNFQSILYEMTIKYDSKTKQHRGYHRILKERQSRPLKNAVKDVKIEF